MARDGKRELTSLERQEIFNTTVFRSTGDLSRIPRLLSTELASKYQIATRTIGRLWQQAKRRGVSKDNLAVDASSNKKGAVGRKLKMTPQAFHAKLLAIPVRQRTSLRCQILNRLGLN